MRKPESSTLAGVFRPKLSRLPDAATVLSSGAGVVSVQLSDGAILRGVPLIGDVPEAGTAVALEWSDRGRPTARAAATVARNLARVRPSSDGTSIYVTVPRTATTVTIEVER